MYRCGSPKARSSREMANDSGTGRPGDRETVGQDRENGLVTKFASIPPKTAWFDNRQGPQEDERSARRYPARSPRTRLESPVIGLNRRTQTEFRNQLMFFPRRTFWGSACAGFGTPRDSATALIRGRGRAECRRGTRAGTPRSGRRLGGHRAQSARQRSWPAR